MNRFCHSLVASLSFLDPLACVRIHPGCYSFSLSVWSLCLPFGSTLSFWPCAFVRQLFLWISLSLFLESCTLVHRCQYGLTLAVGSSLRRYPRGNVRAQVTLKPSVLVTRRLIRLASPLKHCLLYTSDAADE
mgnify:CR=1 FL=1